MNDLAKEQKKKQIYGMNPSLNELLPIYTETLYEEIPADSYVVLKESPEAHVLICVDQKDMTPETETMLQKMLTACRLGPKAVTILGVQGDFSPTLLRRFQTEYILFFGVQIRSEVFRWGKSLNKPFRFHERKWLFSYSLSDIHAQAPLKAELWTNGLKVLFGV